MSGRSFYVTCIQSLKGIENGRMRWNTFPIEIAELVQALPVVMKIVLNLTV
ncbi:MAG: hypothetical protein V3U88_09320 [Methylococcales bacterium]